ncbi:MAG: glucokinase [Gammaproteobacteria bacterium]
MNIIAADVGASSTRLVYAREGRSEEILHEACYVSADFESFETMLRAFIAEITDRMFGFEVLTLALPGIIEDNVARLTNLPWVISKAEIRDEFGVEQVHFMNNFQAAAYAIDRLTDSDMVVLNAGLHSNDATRVIVGAGAGLGMAWCQGQRNHSTAYATEGGHIDFAPVNATQIALLQYLFERYEHVSYERLLSSAGLVNIYEFYAQQSADDIDAEWVQAQALTNNMEAQKAMALFVQIYGSYVGNIALLFKPEAGIYIAGGIAGKIIRWMQSADFIDAYLNKGRMLPLVENISVNLVTNERVGVIGALSHAVMKQQAATTHDY